MSNPLAERVAWVPRRLLEELQAVGQGFRGDDDRRIYDAVLEHASFDAREHLEEDPTRKQAIPYVVLTSGDRIFAMRRKREQTESRLHDLISIGVGGHIPDDLHQEDDLLAAGMRRELHEEVWLESKPDIHYRGTLNDDSNEVGQVHLGFVFSAEVPEDDVAVREVDKIEGWWTDIHGLERSADRLETWSALLLPHLSGWLENTT